MFPKVWPLKELSDQWWFVLAAIGTVAIVSYIYRENVMFRIAEHVLIGVAFGYSFTVMYFNVGQNNFVNPVFKEGDLWPIVPAVLGLMAVLRIVPKLSWVSRYPMAMLIGLSMGMALPRSLQSTVFAQVYGTTRIDFTGSISQGWPWGVLAVVGGAVLIVGTLSALMYFYFSMEHRGFVGGTAKVGIIFLMIGFGASFGYTVQARISLFAARVLFILRDWLGIIT
jgi:hypothetical protein